jgi:hypothetical protein
MRLVYGLAGVLLTFAFVLYPLLALSNSTGALPGANGSPVSATGIGLCTACHSSFDPNEGEGSVTIDAPDSFVPGEAITFTVTLDNATPPTGTPRQGFQVSVEDADAVAHVGALGIVDAATTQFSSGLQEYVTHTLAGTELTAWTVAWTAPADAPETVTIYAAGNAANGDGGTLGDYVYTDAVTLTRTTVSNEEGAAPLVARVDAVYPNPFAQAAAVDYTLERPMAVTVTLYDGLGRAVRVLEDGVRGAGAHTVAVAAGDLPAGVYFVEVRTPETSDTRPLTLAR